MQLAATLEQPGDHGTVIAHRTGDRDLVALAALVKLDGHIFHLEAAVGQLEAGAHQPGQIGVHFHRGQQQLFGVGSHTGPQHGHKPHQNQDRDQQAQRLPPPAALQPGVFFRGDIMFCHFFDLPRFYC